MTDDVANIIVEQLRFIRGDIATMKAGIVDLKERVTNLEGLMGRVIRTVAEVEAHLLRMNGRFDRLEARLDA